MVHQVKRLESPAFMVINHDATQMPNLRLSPPVSMSGLTYHCPYLSSSDLIESAAPPTEVVLAFPEFCRMLIGWTRKWWSLTASWPTFHAGDSHNWNGSVTCMLSDICLVILQWGWNIAEKRGCVVQMEPNWSMPFAQVSWTWCLLSDLWYPVDSIGFISSVYRHVFCEGAWRC